MRDIEKRPQQARAITQYLDTLQILLLGLGKTLNPGASVLARLPEGVRTELGPDATGLGWVYQYALVDTSGKQSIADLRSYQDWYLRYYLRSVPGVADVAPIGGYERQYQVNLDRTVCGRTASR